MSAELPLNVALDHLDPRVLLIYGAADPRVARLTAGSVSGPPRPVDLTPAHGGKVYFAYAVNPGTASDLTAFDGTDQQIYSAAGKIREFETP
ncbi:hypothetical protein ACWC5I_14810 [Kitasatospora sp. NPDC001574]